MVKKQQISDLKNLALSLHERIYGERPSAYSVEEWDALNLEEIIHIGSIVASLAEPKKSARENLSKSTPIFDTSVTPVLLRIYDKYATEFHSLNITTVEQLQQLLLWNTDIASKNSFFNRGWTSKILNHLDKLYPHITEELKNFPRAYYDKVEKFEDSLFLLTEKENRRSAHELQTKNNRNIQILSQIRSIDVPTGFIKYDKKDKGSIMSILPTSWRELITKPVKLRSFPPIKTDPYYTKLVVRNNIHRVKRYFPGIRVIKNSYDEPVAIHLPSSTTFFKLSNLQSDTPKEEIFLDSSDYLFQQAYIYRNLPTTFKGMQELLAPVSQRSIDNFQTLLGYSNFGEEWGYFKLVDTLMPYDVSNRLQKAFIKKRTGKTEETFTDDMGYNAVPKPYFYHKAGFIRSEFGAYNPDDTTNVLASGITSMFFGDNGGLIGSEKPYFKPDFEHRNFTLGMLAVI